MNIQETLERVHRQLYRANVRALGTCVPEECVRSMAKEFLVELSIPGKLADPRFLILLEQVVKDAYEDAVRRN